MSEKKKILIFIDWFLPGYKAGGPIRSVANMVEALHEYFDFHIITSDRDMGDFSPYEELRYNVPINKGNYTITYLSPQKRTAKFYKVLFSDLKPDMVYFNSLFSFKFTILPLYIAKKYLLSKSIIIAPRGMLGIGALGIKKTKKGFFLFVSKVIKLYSGVKWHATTSDEEKDIKRIFGNKTNTFIAENLSEKPKVFIKKEKNSETKFVFISRISKKKNLLFAIELLKQIDHSENVVFDIFGPIEDADYKLLCEKTKENLHKNIRVQYKGELTHSKINETLEKYQFFLFPSLHENYGHAIFEALSNSCPVILSDQTPWRQLEEKNIGWDISLKNKEKFQTAIQTCIDMKQEEYDTMSENAFNFARDYFSNSDAIEQTKKLFE